MATRLLAKLYTISRKAFTGVETEDIIRKATPEEIAFYYRRICCRDDEYNI